MQNLGVPRLLGCGNWGVVCAKLSLLAYLEYYSPRYRGNKLGHCARCMALSLFLLYFEDVLWLISFYRGSSQFTSVECCTGITGILVCALCLIFDIVLEICLY